MTQQPYSHSSYVPIEERIKAMNIKTWLELEALTFGTPNQLERYRADLLPDAELTQLARDVLFKPLTTCMQAGWLPKRFVRLTPGDIHNHRCTIQAPKYETTELAELTHDAWETLKKIVALAKTASEHEWLMRSGQAFKVEPLEHWAECPVCKAEARRPSALVSVMWAGRPLSREYSL